MSSLNSLAEAALKEVSESRYLGLGSGSTVSCFVKVLGRAVAAEKRKIFVIPSSTQIQLVAEESGLEVADLSSHLTKLEVTVDGADQIDEDLNLLKGGGGALYKERILINSSRSVIILADESKFVKKLSLPVPVEFSPFARQMVEQDLRAFGGQPQLRRDLKDYPFFTENGNLIFDADYGSISDPQDLYKKIKNVFGVVEVGLFTIRPLLILKGVKGKVQRLQC